MATTRHTTGDDERTAQLEEASVPASATAAQPMRAFRLNIYAHLFRAARHAKEAWKQLEAEYGDLLRDASKGASNS